MLTPIMYQIFGLSFKLANILGSCGLIWEKNRRQTSVSKMFIIKSNITLLMVIANTCFLAWQIYRRTTKTDNIQEKSILLMFLLFHFMVLIGMTSVIWMPYVVSTEINSLITYVEGFKEKWIFYTDQLTSRLNVVASLSCILCVLVSTLLTTMQFLHFWTNSQSPIYITNLVEKNWLILNGIMGFFYVFLFASILSNLMLHSQVIVHFCFFITPIFMWDLRGNRKQYRTLKELRDPNNFPVAYRSLEVCHGMGMAFYGQVILPFHAIIYFFIVISAKILIKDHNHLDITTKCFLLLIMSIFTMFWVLVLKVAGFYFRQSVKTIKSFQYLKWPKENEAYLKKFTKSCRPLRIGHPVYFKISNLTLLFFVRGVSRGIVRALLTL